MATAELPQPHVARRPFRALEDTLDDTIAHWNHRADGEVAGGDPDGPLIGGDTSGTSPRATVTLIGNGGTLSRGGTLIGSSGTRAPLEPAPPAGSGARRSEPGRPDGAWDAADGLTLDHDLLQNLADDRERLLDIARALGACPECWGERIGCPRCGGVGRPGTETPATEAFDWYVRPLLARLGPDGPLGERARPIGSEAHPAGRGPAYWVDPD